MGAPFGKRIRPQIEPWRESQKWKVVRESPGIFPFLVHRAKANLDVIFLDRAKVQWVQ
jgi:hypothetical protein